MPPTPAVQLRPQVRFPNPRSSQVARGRWSRVQVLVTVSLVAATTWGTDVNRLQAQENSSRVLGVAGTGVGPVRIPCALPSWIDGDPLSVIARQLEIGDGSEGRDLLLRLVRERGRALILPDTSLKGRDTLDPPWQVLGDWYSQLPSPSRERLRLSEELSEREFATGPIDAASPLLWLPGLENLARLRLEEAIENGDRCTAILLARRPRLSERIHPTLRRWIAADPVLDPAPPEPPLPHGDCVLEVSVSIDLAANPLDNLDTLPRPRSRRIPIADFEPAMGEGVALIPGGRGPFALDLNPPYKRLWNLPIAYPGNVSTPGPLRDNAWMARSIGGRLVVPLRTPRREYSPTIEWVHEDPDLNDWHLRGWNEPGTFVWDGSENPPTPLPSAHLAMEGFTIGGIPCVIGNRIHWIATRGFDEVETWLFALDLVTGQELWRVQVGTISLPWHAMNDLAGLLPEGRIVPYRDELFVIARGGAIGRVGRIQGDLRGVLLYPKTRSAPRTGKWGLYYFAHVPAFRPRYLSDGWIDTDESGRARLITLPPDSNQILGIDLEEWTIAWAHPAPSLGLLRRDPDNVPWVIDLTIPAGEHSISVWSLEPETGRLRESKNVSLEIPGGKRRRGKHTIRFAPTAQDVSPLISGVPTLVGGCIAIPLRNGWAFWSRTPLVGGPPDHWIPWPKGSFGGTIREVGKNRYLAIHRADPEWRSRSVVEVLRIAEAGASEENPDSETGDEKDRDPPADGVRGKGGR